MNQPDRVAQWVCSPDEMMEIIDDAKLPGSILIILRAQDHTIGNLIRSQLLLDPNVLFAGYRLPHPQDNKVEIRIQTDPNMNPYVSPRKALSNACIAIVNQCRDLRKSFEEQADVFDVREQAGAGGVNGGGFGAGAGVQAGRDGYGQPIGAGYDGYLGGGMGGGQADDPYAY